jgi:hypothetical protein
MRDARILRWATLATWLATLASLGGFRMGLPPDAAAMIRGSAGRATSRASVHITGSLSSALVLQVKGSVRPLLLGAHVAIEVESPAGRWARIGPSVRLSRRGTFSISAHIGTSRTLSIRAVVRLNGRTMARSQRLIVTASSGSVLGDKEAGNSPTPSIQPTSGVSGNVCRVDESF